MDDILSHELHAAGGLLKERLLTLFLAAMTVPCRPGGGSVHPSTLRRWARRGVRGVRLEVVVLGGAMCTSAPAIARFHERLRPQSGPPARRPRGSRHG